MGLPETQKKILDSNEFVLSETEKIQYAYALKHETRYIVERHEDVASESVAEHVYALHVLADYFLPLEDTKRTWDWLKVHSMLQYHDLDEIETGDTIAYLKTEQQRQEERTARLVAVSHMPEHMQAELEQITGEYENRSSREALFVKALDAIEPLFQLYNENGRKIFALQKATRKNSQVTKEPHVTTFPYIQRFNQVLDQTLEKEGFYYET